MSETNPLVITGLGMVSSLGRDVVSSCAALRCNMDRVSPVDGEMVWDPRSEEDYPLSGHQVSGLTEGYQGIGRWIRLGRKALLDLLDYADLAADDAAWRRAGFVLCTAEVDEERFMLDRSDVEAAAHRLLKAVGLTVEPANVLTVSDGHRAAIAGLAEARKQIQARRWDRAVVLAVNSLLDESSLRWLREADRLKTPEYPVGLVPGEAASCVLVEDAAHAVGQADAELVAVGLAEEPDDDPDTRPGARRRDPGNTGQRKRRPYRRHLRRHEWRGDPCIQLGQRSSTAAARQISEPGQDHLPRDNRW